MVQSERRFDVYRHKESNMLLFVAAQSAFPSDFNRAYWTAMIRGALAPAHVMRGLKNGPYFVTTLAAIEKL